MVTSREGGSIWRAGQCSWAWNQIIDQVAPSGERTEVRERRLVDVPRDYAKAISPVRLSASSLLARIELQQVIAIIRFRKRVQSTGTLESLAFEPLLPLPGFRGPRQDEVREAQFSPECRAPAPLPPIG